MAFDLITLALFGHPDPSAMTQLEVEGAPGQAPYQFDVHHFAGDAGVGRVIASVQPHAIFSFGDIDRYPRLRSAPIDVRRRWLHFDQPPSPDDLAAAAELVFIDVTTVDRFPDEPLVSVFTPTYETGRKVMRPYRSLLAQTYSNWEWVVYDDSVDASTFELVSRLAADEPRIKVFRSDRRCGRIGEVKRRCCGLARGTILVELDHDDELTDHCLADIVEAFATFPDAGFAYTDCAEVFEDGGCNTYGETFAFGFGSYRVERDRDVAYQVMNYPSVNAMTVRHIVGMPNHARAWRRSEHERIGGYGSEVHVADDYEICVRAFLSTRIVHVQRFGYKQYLGRDGENTQFRRNAEIQHLVRLFHARYEAQIHDRLVELGVDDFIWKDGVLDWSAAHPEPVPIANYVLT